MTDDVEDCLLGMYHNDRQRRRHATVCQVCITTTDNVEDMQLFVRYVSQRQMTWKACNCLLGMYHNDR